MKLDYRKKKIQKNYREVVKKKTEPLWINVISVIVIVLFILNLYIDWL